MLSRRESVSVGVWKIYETYDLEIAPSLAGAKHVFEYRGFGVTVSLPKKPRQKDWHSENSPITCRGYRIRSKRKVPLSYIIHQLDVLLNTGVARQIQPDALGAVNVSLFSRSERNRLDKLANSYAQVLEEAFHYWIDILRWKSEIPTICHFQYKRQKTKWGTYLVDVQTRERFYAPPNIFTIVGQRAVSKRSWNQAQRALSEEAAVPVWHLNIAEAHQKLRLGDTRGFIINLAIASETLVRQVTKSFLKPPINPTYQNIVNNVSIARILDRWQKLGFDNTQWKRIRPQRKLVQDVFEIRNAIIHRGEEPTISATKARELGNAVIAFTRQGEKELEIVV